MDTNEEIDVPQPATTKVTWRHYTVALVSFLFLTAYNMTFITFSQYVYKKLQLEYYPNVTDVSPTIAICVENTSSIVYAIQLDTQQRAAKWGIYLYLSGGITSVLSNFILGAFTDRFGRKFLFLLPCIGTIVRTAGAIAGIRFNLPLWYYTFGYFLEGCTGQLFTIIQVSYLYIVDITVAGKRRSFGIVMIELVLGVGTLVPNLATGYILQYSKSFQVPFIISGGILLVTLLLVLTLPESFPKHVRAKRKYISKIENLKDSIDLYVSKKNKGRRWMYILILLVFALTTYDLFGRISVEGLYLLNYPFCWDPQRLGLFGAARAVAQQLLGMLSVKVFHMCMDDEMIAIIGCLSYAASFIMEAFATTDAMVFAGIQKCERKTHFDPFLLSRPKKDNFANSVDPDETARNEPSHLDLHCLSLCSWFMVYTHIRNNGCAQNQSRKSPLHKLTVERVNKYSRTSMSRTSLGRWKFVLDMGSSSH